MKPERYSFPERRGYTSLLVLTQIYGRPWDDRAKGLIHALRPSSVRVTPDDEEKLDARCWRVTVHLNADRRIERITQEVEVGLADGFRFGADVDAWLRDATEKPVCPKCKGSEQIWKVFWKDHETGAEGLLGVSAFLDWTGTEAQAKDLATQKTVKASAKSPSGVHITTYTARQHRCLSCGSTNNPKEK